MNWPIISAFGVAIAGLCITATSGFFALRAYLREDRKERTADFVRRAATNQLVAREAVERCVVARGHRRSDSLKIHKVVLLSGGPWRNFGGESTDLRRRRDAMAARA